MDPSVGMMDTTRDKKQLVKRPGERKTITVNCMVCKRKLKLLHWLGDRPLVLQLIISNRVASKISSKSQRRPLA